MRWRCPETERLGGGAGGVGVKALRAEFSTTRGDTGASSLGFMLEWEKDSPRVSSEQGIRHPIRTWLSGAVFEHLHRCVALTDLPMKSLDLSLEQVVTLPED